MPDAPIIVKDALFDSREDEDEGRVGIMVHEDASCGWAHRVGVVMAISHELGV